MTRVPSSWSLEGWAIQPDAAISETAATLPGVGVLHTWRVLHLLALRAAAPPSSPPRLDGHGMETLEEAILRADYDEGIRYPLAVLTRYLFPGVEPDPGRLAWACLCAADWAFGRGGAPAVGRSFVYAAARLSGLAPYLELARRVAGGGSSEANDREHREDREAAGGAGGRGGADRPAPEDEAA